MKKAIIIETREDFERVVPFLSKIHQLQKVGKYLFYRLVFVCQTQEEKDLKKCMKEHKIKVPYSFWKKNENGTILQKESLPHFFEEELFRNPVELVLLMQKSPISKMCLEIAQKYKIKVALLDDTQTGQHTDFQTDFIFPLKNGENSESIVEEIVKMYQL